jgi:chaperone modulatory protein CbpM
MMMLMDEVVAAIESLKREDLEIWVREALVRPNEDSGTPVFNETECARIQLICTLHYDMDVEVDTLPVIMELIDQLHESRQRIHSLSNAILAQDESVRAAILEILKGEQDTSSQG